MAKALYKFPSSTPNAGAQRIPRAGLANRQSSNYWARIYTRLGHETKHISGSNVKIQKGARYVCLANDSEFPDSESDREKPA